MAVKASATITLSFMVDVKAVYRYYKLQASTASTPLVPTVNPPSGWVLAEPSYTSGSTNTLYTTDLTVFTNNTFSYSAVSKSTSYEAAKEAYNKAVNAGKTATNYLYTDTTNGLQVGDKSSGSWSGSRARMKSTSFDILDQNGEALASFGSTATVGKTSSGEKNVKVDTEGVSIRNGTDELSKFSAYSVNGHSYAALSSGNNINVGANIITSSDENNVQTYRNASGGVTVTSDVGLPLVWADLSGKTWSNYSSTAWAVWSDGTSEKTDGSYFETEIYSRNDYSITSQEPPTMGYDPNVSNTTRSYANASISLRTGNTPETNYFLTDSFIEISANNISIKAVKSLTYSIPVVYSGLLSDITTSGKYYIGNGISDRPVGVNGWLEVMKYSGNFCFQRYTTYTGRTYERNMQNSVWGAWGRQMREHLLFNNDSQTLSVAPTLSETAANFDKLTIMYRSNDNCFASVDVWKPNGKLASLTATYYSSGSQVYVKTKTVKISGTSIVTQSVSSFYLTGTVAANGSNTPTHEDSIGITQVIGWR